MEYFNPSQKLVFISILSLIVFHSLPFTLIQPIVAQSTFSPSSLPSPKNDDSFLSFLSDSSSESEEESNSSVPEDDLTNHGTMAPESSVSFPFLTDLDHDQAFRPSNEDPPSDENVSSAVEQPAEPSDNDDDSFSKIDLDNIGTLFPNPHTNTNNVDPKLKNICNSTDYPHLCLSTVAPFLKGRTDLMSVLEVSMKISKHVAKLGLVMARRIVNSPATPEPLASKLRPCLDSYDDALYNFENAMDALRSRDVGTMNSMLSAVLTDVGDCKDELTGLRFPSHMSRFSDNLSNMTSNCLAMIDLLNK